MSIGRVVFAWLRQNLNATVSALAAGAAILASVVDLRAQRRQQFVNQDTLLACYASIGKEIQLITRLTSSDERNRAESLLHEAEDLKNKIHDPDNKSTTKKLLRDEYTGKARKIQDEFDKQLTARRAWLYYFKRLKKFHEGDGLPPAEYWDDPSTTQIQSFLKECQFWDQVNCASMEDCNWAHKPGVYRYIEEKYFPEKTKSIEKRSRKKYASSCRDGTAKDVFRHSPFE
eukprot:m.14057 g.14057  ORF g.14057 m.14057 type:complete len:230 (-) comp10296_c0_seq2:457-1146(-)